MPLLEAVGIARRAPRAEAWLVDHVSLAVPAGRIIGVSGPSGSGKTLLLRAMAMLDPVDAGEVRLRGEPARRDRVPGFRSQVAYLHQRPALLGQTVREALARPYAIALRRGQRFDTNRAEAMFQTLGRDTGFLDKKTGDLSGGEAQIAALVRTAALDPTVLLLDEPTSALDPATAQAVERWLVDWIAAAPDGRAIVWVSHDAAQVERLGIAPWRMCAGRLSAGDET
ncbi:MAG: ATP-binding cassette domain-containing protein [Pirellulales bacterium]|nr:ATP-binding cassette domain-containing protein [Pirellulales bacterium]